MMTMSRVLSALHLTSSTQSNTCALRTNEPDEIDERAHQKASLSFDVKATKSSKGVQKIYLNNDVLSVFVGNTFYGQLAMQGMRAEECLNNIVRYGKRQDEGHHTWHKSESDFEIEHMHLIKGNFEKITPNEFKCMMDNLLRFEKGFRNYLRASNQTRIDSGEQCVLADDPTILSKHDHDYLIKKYRAFYHNKSLSEIERENIREELKDKLTEVNDKVVISMKEASKSLSHVFINTLLHNYLKPYLISERHYNSNQVAWACEVVTAAMNIGMDVSPLNAGFSFVLRQAIQPALLKIGIDIEIIKRIAAKLETLAAITENPLSLIQLGINYSMATVGQEFAYGVIAMLPKLKQEPRDRQEMEASIVQDNALPFGLRHR